MLFVKCSKVNDKDLTCFVTTMVVFLLSHVVPLEEQ